MDNNLFEIADTYMKGTVEKNQTDQLGTSLD